MGPIVWTSYKTSRFKHDMLPPLADYDHLKNLVGKSFPVSIPLVAGAGEDASIHGVHH